MENLGVNQKFQKIQNLRRWRRNNKMIFIPIPKEDEEEQPIILKLKKKEKLHQNKDRFTKI